MKIKKDELLNKYIDNELDNSELEEFNNLLKNDESIVKELKAMKLVEQSLRKIEFDKAPEDTTYKIMKKIEASGKVKQSNWFFWFVISFFGTCIAGILFFVFSIYKPSETGLISNKTLDTVKDFVNVQSQSATNIINGIDLKVAGIVITLIFCITLYFIYEMRHSFKNRLKSL